MGLELRTLVQRWYKDEPDVTFKKFYVLPTQCIYVFCVFTARYGLSIYNSGCFCREERHIITGRSDRTCRGAEEYFPLSEIEPGISSPAAAIVLNFNSSVYVSKGNSFNVLEFW